jgi:Zn-dependent peptidase ImmA (M78 family)/DNA-binding XRE family transcriptional regulator
MRGTVAQVEALVEPELLIWARRKAGYLTVEEAAAKANVSAANLTAWEEGRARPSLPQLRKLGKAYRRRIAVFYLPEPPKDFPPIKDYRVIHGAKREAQSPELLAEVREAHERREIALDLLEDAGERAPSFRLKANLAESPEEVATRIRRALGVTTEEQADWHDGRIGFNAWRFAAERLGVLVTQMTTVARHEARGFSIAETPLPLVAANNEDPYVARSFTLIHELAHVGLHASGLCDLADSVRVERFCNHVGGAVLVPPRALLGENVVREHGVEPAWSDRELRRLATTYGVSREVIVRRLLILGRTDEHFYNSKRAEYESERQDRIAHAEEREWRWGPSPATTAVARAGHFFSRVVLDSYSRGSITASDVAQYLNVRVKHLPSIEKAVFRPRS